MNKSKKARIEELLNLPWEDEYRITRIPEDEGGGFAVSIPLLGDSRCVGDGDTIAEAIEDLHKVLADMLGEYLEKGYEIHTPEPRHDYKGAILVRTTPDIHYRLAREAKNQGVSINHLANLILERGLNGFQIENAVKECISLVTEASNEFFSEISYQLSEMPNLDNAFDMSFALRSLRSTQDEASEFENAA